MAPSLLMTDPCGLIGRLVLRELTIRGVPIRVLARSPVDKHETDAVLPQGVDGDPFHPDTLDASLDGVERVLLVSPPSPDQVLLQGSLIEAIERTGRPIHLITVSVLGVVPPDALLRLARWQTVTEAQIESSGLPTTIVRPQLLMQSLLRTASSIRSDDMLCGSFNGARLPLVDGRDVARVTATLLTTEGHNGRRYDLTGPQLVSFFDVAEVFSSVLGRPIRYVDMPSQTYHEYLVGSGLPNWIADDLTLLARSFRSDYRWSVTSDVSRITGQPAQTLAGFIRDHLDVFQPGGSDAPDATTDTDFWCATTVPPTGPRAGRPQRPA